MAARVMQSSAHTDTLRKLLTFAFHEGLGLCFHSQPSHQFLASKMNVRKSECFTLSLGVATFSVV